MSLRARFDSVQLHLLEIIRSSPPAEHEVPAHLEDREFRGQLQSCHELARLIQYLALRSTLPGHPCSYHPNAPKRINVHLFRDGNELR